MFVRMVLWAAAKFLVPGKKIKERKGACWLQRGGDRGTNTFIWGPCKGDFGGPVTGSVETKERNKIAF